eukprot:m.198258 g.198258  ORF g.198258 m.198258 type:complete len:431 (-) comp14919_c0_seq1:2555-3847(-)
MATSTSPIAERYDMMNKAGEGTFSEVVKCVRKADGVPCAVKRMKGKFTSVEQVDNLREVQALRRLNPHPNIIQMHEVIYDTDKRTLDLVFELMEMNMYERIKGKRAHLPEDLVKGYMYQLCKALDHMHRHGIFHRDVKPENVLIQDTQLKLADLGSCRGIYSKPPFTEYISTRWYRAPECLLTNGYYGHKMDVWSVGCVMFEVMSLYPLFPGANELDQINKIHEIVGTPSAAVLNKIRKNSSHFKANFPNHPGKGLAKLLPQASRDCIELLQGMLEYDPDARLSARQCLKHPYFKDLRAEDKRKARASSAAKHGGHLSRTATVAAAHADPTVVAEKEKGTSLSKALRTKLSLHGDKEKPARGLRALSLRKARTTQELGQKGKDASAPMYPLLTRRLTTKATASSLGKDGAKLPPLVVGRHRSLQGPKKLK